MELQLRPAEADGGAYSALSLDELLAKPAGGRLASASLSGAGGASPTLEELLAASPRRVAQLRTAGSASPRKQFSPRDVPQLIASAELEETQTVYYRTQSGEQASVDLDKIGEAVASGDITDDTIIWTEGLGDEWATLSEAVDSTAIAEDLQRALSQVSADSKQKLLQSVWSRADTDGTGLDREKVRGVLVQMGREEAELDMDQAMLELGGAEHGGLVSFQAFEAWWEQQELEAQQRLYAVFYRSKDGEQQETTLSSLPDLLASGAIDEDTIIW